MNETKRVICAAVGLLAAVAACSASGGGEGAETPPLEADAGGPVVDAGQPADAAPDVDLDAERPLVCGDAGFCETRLPASDTGVPLSLRAVWVVSSNDVWSVTAEGYVLHYDGASWQVAYRTRAALSAVWATATSVWAGGEGGIVLRRSADGAWTQLGTDHASMIHAISGTSDVDVWFASEDGRVDRFDGAALKGYPIDIPGIRVTTIAGRPGRGMYAAGFVYGNGRYGMSNQAHILELTPSGALVFSSVESGFTPVAIDVVGSAESDRLFIFGYKYVDVYPPTSLQHGIVERGGDVALHEMVPPQRPRFALQSMCVWDRNDIGGGRTPWGTESSIFPCPAWLGSRNDVLMPFGAEFEFNYLLRWDGTKQTSASLAMGSSFIPRAIWGVHGNSADVWLVGNGFALKGAAP